MQIFIQINKEAGNYIANMGNEIHFLEEIVTDFLIAFDNSDAISYKFTTVT